MLSNRRGGRELLNEKSQVLKMYNSVCSQYLVKLRPSRTRTNLLQTRHYRRKQVFHYHKNHFIYEIYLTRFSKANHGNCT